ncbi:hypothetical protein HAX54_034273, partial [Datura stramonium]|nr:hypothetical protein [Datura stramonium]
IKRILMEEWGKSTVRCMVPRISLDWVVGSVVVLKISVACSLYRYMGRPEPSEIMDTRF